MFIECWFCVLLLSAVVCCCLISLFTRGMLFVECCSLLWFVVVVVRFVLQRFRCLRLVCWFVDLGLLDIVLSLLVDCCLLLAVV